MKKMKYEFGGRLNGKSWAQMIQLKQNIEKGLICSVATMSTLKVKRDFEYMTGSELILESNGEGNIYQAKLK